MVDWLFPRRCVFCRDPHPDKLCDACQSALPWRVPCDTGGIIAPLYYKDTVRLAMHRYKFRGFSGYAEVFGTLMAQAVIDACAKTDVAAWVPCSFFRRWSRGYDQSEKLARVVAKQLSLPAEKLLRKKRNTKPQTKMSGDGARAANVQGAFTASPAARGKRILLIDDIYTSGATLSECRAILLAAGAGDVVYSTTAVRMKNGNLTK
jgi:ComF family protein